MKITGTTGLFALFGSPVSHSGSPAMYNYSFEKLGLDYVYVAIDIGKKNIKEMVEAARLFGLKGFNLTMPCKNETVHYLDEVSTEAKIVGAVNTVVNDNGILKGYITDGSGFVDNLEAKGISVKDKKITIVGSGGAGTAIQVELAKRGVREVSVLSRKNGFFDRAIETAKKIKEIHPSTLIKVNDSQDIPLVTSEVLESDIFINASIIGMKPKQEETVIKDKRAFHKDLIVCDCVYNPVETRLLFEAKEAGLKTVDGRGMLLYQGAQNFKIFTGMDMPVQEVAARFFLESSQ